LTPTHRQLSTSTLTRHRYYLQYHTPIQVLSGLALGALFGSAYFALVELWPVRAPESIAGRLRTWLVANPASTWLRVRDGWAVWDDGGFESAWGVWRREWERRRQEETGGKKRS
jgi:dolichyldiphosphatase